MTDHLEAPALSPYRDSYHSCLNHGSFRTDVRRQQFIDIHRYSRVPVSLFHATTVYFVNQNNNPTACTVLPVVLEYCHTSIASNPPTKRGTTSSTGGYIIIIITIITIDRRKRVQNSALTFCNSIGT